MTSVPARPNPSAASSALANDAMRRLLSVARALSATDDLGQVLSVIIDAMRDLLDAERATVFEFDAASSELFTTVAHGVSSSTNNGDSFSAQGSLTTGIRIPITRGIAGECARHRATINVPDAYADPRFNREVDKQTGFVTRSILAVPLVGVDGELIGVAQILNKRGRPFGEEDQEIALALAGQAAVAMKRARLLLDRMVREKLEREIEVARRLQQQTFPKQLPQPEGYEIVGFSEPADRTGGDAFDAIPLWCDNTRWRASGEGRPVHGAMLLMADATGHGVGPALSVTQARSMLRMGARLGSELDRVARHMNEQLCEDLVTGRFITAWLGLLDARENLLHSVSAGQAPLLVLRASKGEVENRDADVLPLGIMRGLELPPRDPIALAPGDAFIALSDGFYESQNPQGEQFGVKRVAAIVKRTSSDGADAMLGAIKDELSQFTNDAPAEDDRTALIVLRRS
jgi:phosphoserine phosphatase